MEFAGGANWVAVVAQTALLLLLVVLSGAFSGAEAVLFSLSRVELQQQAQSPQRLRRVAARLMERPQETLRTILVGNTLVNVLLFATAYVLFHRLVPAIGPWAPVLSAVTGVGLVTVFGEAVPKIAGVNLAARLTPLAAGLVKASSIVLEPLGRAIAFFIVRPAERLLLGASASGSGPRSDLTTEELKTLLEMSRRHGVINTIEGAFLREVVDLGHLRVRDVMVPRVEVQAYDVNGPPDGLRRMIRDTRRKKIPVYDGSIDRIVGLVYAKVLFFEQDKPLRSLVMPVRFVPAIITCEQLLAHFRKTRTQLAVAVDEYGGMAGIVTLEDVMEAIVGDISEAGRPRAEEEIVQKSETEYEVSGRLSIHYWADTFGLPRSTERVATVGGLVTGRLGRPARVGDKIALANLEMEVIEVERRRVERLRIRLRKIENEKDQS